MVDTVFGGINHVEQSQSGKYATINEGLDTLDAMASMGIRGNRLMNSGLRSWQEGTSFVSPTTGAWFADVFRYQFVHAGAVTISRSTDVPSALSSASIDIAVTTADAVVAATDFAYVEQYIEGPDIRDALLGTAGALAMYLRFNVKSNKTGTYCVSFTNSAGNRSYVAEYTINAANTWETKTISLTGDLTGTWLVADAVAGLRVRWALMAGTNFQGPATTWSAADDVGTASQANLLDTVSNFLRFTSPRLYVGIVPATATGAIVGEREYALELERIKRYFERVNGGAVSGSAYGAGMATGVTTAIVPIFYPEKAKVPAISVSAAADFDVLDITGAAVAVTGLTPGNISKKSARMAVTVAAGLVAGSGTLLVDDTTASSFVDIDARVT